MFDMLKKSSFLFVVLMLAVLSGKGQELQSYSFRVIPLGVKGGIDESNLSSYMVAPRGSNHYVCLDAGTLHYGIQKALAHKVLTGRADRILRENIKGYLISHAHLDHISGMIINSPDDSPKNIYALPAVLHTLKDKYFTWDAWANFANEGEKPVLNKYTYIYLEENKETALQGTEMTVKAFTLSHASPHQSTAFLLQNGDANILYLGDTGADEIERSDKLQLLWQQVAPLIKERRLKAIFLETSFSNEQPENQLFGHLTPHLFMKEMNKLGKLSGVTGLQRVPLVITHIKPSGDNEQKIREQLNDENDLRLKLVFPRQGKVLKF